MGKSPVKMRAQMYTGIHTAASVIPRVCRFAELGITDIEKIDCHLTSCLVKGMDRSYVKLKIDQAYRH